MKNTITVKSWVALFTLEFILALLFLLLSAAVFSWMADYIFISKRVQFDNAVYAWVHAGATAERTRWVQWFTALGSGTVLLPVYVLVLVYLLLKKRRLLAIAVFTIALCSMLLNQLLKGIFQRSRPALEHLDHVRGYSFPSGHSMGAFTFCGLMLLLLWQSRLPRWLQAGLTVVLLLYACAIAWSRVYLGVHYASDVIGGFLVTVLWLSLCFMVFHLIRHRNNRKKATNE